MKTKSMVQTMTKGEMETVKGGKVQQNEAEKTYNGGTLQEIVVTPSGNHF